MRRIFQLLKVLLGGLVLAGLATYVWLATTTVGAGDLPALKTGDIVFQDSGSGQGKAIMIASGSPYTHVGLIELVEELQPHVVEAVGPVKSTPLANWIARGTAGRITVKRVKGLSEGQAQSVLAAAHAYDGKPYDPFFYKGHDAIYCSELVHLAYLEGAKIEVGKEERVKELRVNNGIVRKLVEARWRQYPACIAAQSANLDECYPLILEETLVTPASVARDLKLETVFSNFGVLGD